MATGLLTPPPTPAPADEDRDATVVLPGDNAATATAISVDDDGTTTVVPVSGDQPTKILYSKKRPGPPARTAPSRTGAATDSSGPLEVGQGFGSRYHIIRALGIGGMGAVYQAWDAELGVAVAMKVIRPDVMADPTAAADVERRFKRELLLARQVTHKNVVRIYDLGEIDGVKYITMSYVDGADLATQLKRDGTLPIPTVLPIARQIVSGLVAAHKAGVVHRDLKPANIMIDGSGDALIMDFGIARSSGGPKAESETAKLLPAELRQSASLADATKYGSIVGTVEYMAPEQARGVEVDQRADMYAFGLILYDMLVGRRRAGRASSAIEELKGRMAAPPPPVKSILPEIPDAVDRLISRCLEPDPAKRYATTEELAAELDRLDDNGVPIPLPRRFTPRLIAASVALVALLVTGTWWLTRTPPAVKPHDPVSVMIADFQNTTGDASFDHTLEPMLRRALEGASFITAYDRTQFRRTFAVKPPDKLDEVAARELAIKQGLGVVVSGEIIRAGSGYDISLKALQTVTGKVVAASRSQAAKKDQVLGAATKLVAAVRKALGDKTSESAQLFGMVTLSTTSLEVVSQYAAAIEAQADGKYEETRRSYLKAVELDPKFGLGYHGLAVMSFNLGKREDADKYAQQALSHLDGMTERERFNTRGFYYRMTGDLQQCVKEYGEMIARYPADLVAHNQRAVCLSMLRRNGEAIEEMRQLVQILPKRLVFRGNLSVYADYASDFQTAEREATAVQQPNDLIVLALAFAKLGQGQLPEAIETYQKLATIEPRGSSWAASGLGEIALFEGRLSDAVQTLEQGADADLAAKKPYNAARKLTSVAYAQLLRGRTPAAVAAAEKALANSNAIQVQFLAARVLVEANALPKARKLGASLASEVAAEPQAYGKIIEGDIALKSADARQAVKILTEANGVLDTWLGHFDLGRAYLAAGAFPQAGSEFDRCIKRRGETLSVLLDEEPTYGYFPIVYYYQGRVSEGLKSAGAADSYREYLKIRGKSTEDPLVPDVRKRAGG